MNWKPWRKKPEVVQPILIGPDRCRWCGSFIVLHHSVVTYMSARESDGKLEHRKTHIPTYTHTDRPVHQNATNKMRCIDFDGNSHWASPWTSYQLQQMREQGVRFS
jgi:hypothetical protein